MPFEIITPMIQNMTVAGTTIDCFIKTVSGTSVNDGSGEGTDVPFISKGEELSNLMILIILTLLELLPQE